MQAKKKTCDGCGEPRYIWKNVSGPDGRKRYCKYCWSCQNPNENKPTVSKPLRSRSPKRAKQETEYSRKRKKFLEKHPHCEVPVNGICTHKATDVHHLDGRVEDDLTDDTKFRAACRKCHNWVHANPADARELGYLI